MATAAAILRELHRLRRHARDLQAEIDRGPKVLRTQHTRVTRQEDLLKEGHDTVKRLKVTTHEKELELKTKMQQIDKHSLQLNQAGSRKEYEALQHEIAADKKAVSDLEDVILNTMTQTDEWTAKLPELEQNVKRAKEELAAFEKGHETRQTELRERLGQTQAELTRVEAELPEEIAPQYKRLLAAMGEDALAAVQKRICSACYTEITAQNHHELVIGQFVLCKSCGRILYLPEP
jgi:predicted  nucleic acid-binding Zn-ribbon protein